MEIDDIKRERDEWQHKAEAAEDALTEALRLINRAEGALRYSWERRTELEVERNHWKARAEDLETRRGDLARSQDKHRKATKLVATLKAELSHLWRRRV